MSASPETDNRSRREFITSISIPVAFVMLLWFIKAAEFVTGYDLTFLGLFPGSISGLKGIIFAPLIHGNFDHLFSNSIPVLFLSWGIIYFYPSAAVKVIPMVYFIPSILDWFFARPSYHIGASGLIYGFVSFLFFSGIIRRDKRAVALALVVTFLYGGLVWGVLPLDNYVSYETHLFGSFTGIVSAFLFRKSDPYKRYDWEDEPDDTDGEKPQISYKKGFTEE